jgi:hypothetical protein
LKKFVSESSEVIVKKTKELKKPKKIDAFYWIPMGVAAAAALSLSACTKAAPQAPKAVSEAAAKQLASDPTKAKEASVYYARLGELLMMPEGAMYADQMFQQALKLDPTNSKAHFYEAFLTPAMTFKGFLPLIDRLASKKDEVGLESTTSRTFFRPASSRLPSITTFSALLAKRSCLRSSRRLII